jgi:osmotically-inducible protein OsmY
MKKLQSAPAILLAMTVIAPAVHSACARPSGTSASAAIDDATVTTRVKTAFINDPVVGGARIDVETFKGVVTLSGRVKSKEEEAKAVELARTIRGVSDVKSTLQIQP